MPTYLQATDVRAPAIPATITPWDSIQPREATDQHGTYTDLAIIPIIPDLAPATGDVYSITFQSSLQAGWFTFTFLNADGLQSILRGPVQLGAGDQSWYPTVQDLAAMLPARATGRFAGGGTVGTASTFPDSSRVQAAIDRAASVVVMQIGNPDTIPAKFHAAISSIIILRTALTLEPSAWPEQARPDKSAWEQFKLLYDEELPALLAVIRLDAEDGDTGDGGASTAFALPLYSFPPPGIHVPGTEPAIAWLDYPGYPAGRDW